VHADRLSHALTQLRLRLDAAARGCRVHGRAVRVLLTRRQRGVALCQRRPQRCDLCARLLVLREGDGGE
jgi:hypothetical protein